MVLGTADEAGVPWVTPVWYAQSDYRRFVWVSSPERRHSRNVRARPEVSIVIFDSQVAVGSALAVYMSARAEELSGAELERDIAFFDTASRAQGLTRRWTLADMLAPAPYRPGSRSRSCRPGRLYGNVAIKAIMGTLGLCPLEQRCAVLLAVEGPITSSLDDAGEWPVEIAGAYAHGDALERRLAAGEHVVLRPCRAFWSVCPRMDTVLGPARGDALSARGRSHGVYAAKIRATTRAGTCVSHPFRRSAPWSGAFGHRDEFSRRRPPRPRAALRPRDRHRPRRHSHRGHATQG
jgi:Pyridoxamine 5'-phosphate oxidase